MQPAQMRRADSNTRKYFIEVTPFLSELLTVGYRAGGEELAEGSPPYQSFISGRAHKNQK
jgi:hypothetical protein